MIHLRSHGVTGTHVFVREECWTLKAASWTTKSDCAIQQASLVAEE